jgi:hypothetical protein
MGNIDVPADQNVDLKKSARRRLVGAIALALFAIVVLPMVMEREPKPPSQDIQVRIPGQESPPPGPGGFSWSEVIHTAINISSSTASSISTFSFNSYRDSRLQHSRDARCLPRFEKHTTS